MKYVILLLISFAMVRVFIFSADLTIRTIEHGAVVDLPDFSHPEPVFEPIDEDKFWRGFILSEIAYQAVQADIDPIAALKIAKCESSYNEQAKSKISTAKGLFQVINGTWAGYCSGDPLNAQDNINCFVKLYKQHPNWWVCKA